MRKRMTWRDLLGYFRTWSSLHKYHEVYPEDKTRKPDIRFLEEDVAAVGPLGPGDVDVTGGDIAVRFWKNLRCGVRDEAMSLDVKVGVNDIVLVEWPVALILVNKM
ncbi:hypothetical protein AGABI1DRAFT_115048 [Agaricus bisporus var. burnettii JB137-S8]|uniref:Uncharacterized protein n=1 Tax=Agaricus bisporus var. burnettii (strain JB137-S8 / ATCC MYA-4627 / FGSC 10392) TaxID=597362 RepID=K5X4D5_AGABU|nr:hypothetical protein AGABI2DRAFT_195435 [Agaricus bisporus var. bisporus H97]XP_007331636.1 uncharacterized protein AGABI1DRAFT_115048 [Agaricus bisporus var. burnettii JB137-S8]EKM77792.1 hypothetical protein AGABI1DRAFT_115048 [Agaricus bisporus var. burnettii JB137-S8]EKV43231.1 hypothetical protein AGABI2DRAFT_195435 [Agaricus bisporus var. bisporus H97]